MNASTDMDMMEAEPSNASASTSVQDPRGLLTMARQLVDQGKPSQALQAVVMAIRAKGGEVAVIQVLQRARELYWNNSQASSEADQLASLFAECALAEAQPRRAEPLPISAQTLAQNPMFTSCADSDAYKFSILAESGRNQIMLDAYNDGSSFICLKCGGLVSMNRKDEHYTYWCQS